MERILSVVMSLACIVWREHLTIMSVMYWHTQEHIMESHGSCWKVPWKVMKTAGRKATETTRSFYGTLRKPLEVSREHHGNFQMILRRFGFLIMVTREELELV